jgi:lysophospholipase L1-like esterase
MPLRRDFLKKAALGGAVGLLTPGILSAATSSDPVVSQNEKKGYTFLFQGDSITDGNRTRNTDWNHVMGHGFAYLIASRLWFDFPEKEFHFFNRGISGNKITDLAARWQADTLDIKSDLLNILVGVNDTEAAVKGNKNLHRNNLKPTTVHFSKRPDKRFRISSLFFVFPFYYRWAG